MGWIGEKVSRYLTYTLGGLFADQGGAPSFEEEQGWA